MVPVTDRPSARYTRTGTAALMRARLRICRVSRPTARAASTTSSDSVAQIEFSSSAWNTSVPVSEVKNTMVTIPRTTPATSRNARIRFGYTARRSKKPFSSSPPLAVTLNFPRRGVASVCSVTLTRNSAITVS